MRRLKITSLPNINKWIDRDELMLHSCFQILQDFIEKEKGDEHCNYEAHKDFVDELRFLYGWWKNRKNKHTTDEQMDEDDVMLIRLIKIRTSLWT
jgi:hypothetical protein